MRRLRWILSAMAAVLLAAHGFALEISHHCAGTPAAALVGAGDSAQGYRVTGTRWDRVLQQGWAVVASCDHPERPSMLLAVNSAASAAPRPATMAVLEALPTVRAGELVHLWKHDSYAHIELVATAEQNGAVGARIRLRLTPPKAMDGQASEPRYVFGVVRGPADVEMLP